MRNFGFISCAILALVWSVPSIQASEALNARCTLLEKSYVTNDYQNYTLVSEQVVSEKTSPLGATDYQVLEDWVSPVGFRAEFNSYHGTLNGSLWIRIDQPGPVDRSKVALDTPLVLQIEEPFNGGKSVYELTCLTTRPL